MASAAQPAGEKTFLGQPLGVAYLAFTEMWERFSFYGMRALLVLYMAQELLLPGRIENVAGMDGYRSVIEAIFGPLSTKAFASQTFGLYAGFVYFTPLFGGLIADRWLGAKRTVLLGIALMTAGHFAMVFDWSFLLALLLLVLGSGCLKGNVAAQVGELYRPDEEARRTSGYTIFSTGINVGAIFGPLACGLLAQIYGWHYGFGLAGIMMLVAALVYLAGWRHFAEDAPKGPGHAAPVLEARDWKVIGLIVFVLVLSLFQFTVYDQLGNAGMLWVADHVALGTPLGDFPVPWFVSEDAFASVVIVPVLIGLWAWQARRGTEPHDMGKMAIGAAVAAISPLALAAGAWSADGGKASLAFPLVAFFASGVAFMFTWPTMLALVSQRAPKAVNARMMAAVYLVTFCTSILAGWIARFYEVMPPVHFWLMHAAIALAGAILLALLGRPLRRMFDSLAAQTPSA